jgi:hypothetical protein
MIPQANHEEMSDDMKALLMVLGGVAAGKPMWAILRDEEVARGYVPVPVGSVPWLPADEWHEHDVVSLHGDAVRIVAIMARRPGCGAFTRLVTDILAAGLIPVVVCPLARMRTILTRWGWQHRETGSTFEDREDLWQPASLTAALGGAMLAAGTDIPTKATDAAGERARQRGGAK